MWILIRSEDKGVWLVLSVLFSVLLFMSCCAFLSSRWRKRVALCSLAPTWICTAQRRLLQKTLLKYVRLKMLLLNNSTSFPFIKFMGPLKVLSLLLFCRRNELVLLTHLRHENRPPVKSVLFLPSCREEAFRASWCLQRLAVVLKTWAQSWSRRWMLCSAGRSPKMARTLHSGVRVLLHKHIIMYILLCHCIVGGGKKKFSTTYVSTRQSPQCYAKLTSDFDPDWNVANKLLNKPLKPHKKNQTVLMTK